MKNIEQNKITVQYFDTKEFALTKNDIWLIKRGDFFELKIPAMENGKNGMWQYQEIEGEEKIREIFAVPRIKSFIEDIADLGYEVFFEDKNSSEDLVFSLEREKVLEFLKRKKPQHYQALREAGILKED